jgi:hypothetical protein
MFASVHCTVSDNGMIAIELRAVERLQYTIGTGWSIMARNNAVHSNRLYQRLVLCEQLSKPY